MLTQNYPPQQVAEIAQVLTWVDEHGAPEKTDADVPQHVLDLLSKWWGVISDEGLTLGKSMISPPVQLTARGHQWRMEAEQQPPAVEQSADVYDEQTLPSEYRHGDAPNDPPLTRKYIRDHPDWGPYWKELIKARHVDLREKGRTGPVAHAYLYTDVLKLYDQSAQRLIE